MIYGTNPDKKVLKYFEVKELSHNVFILTIKISDSFIKQLLISFDNKNTLNQFQILNTSDQRTQIDFSNLKHVESFKKSVFEFRFYCFFDSGSRIWQFST